MSVRRTLVVLAKLAVAVTAGAWLALVLATEPFDEDAILGSSVALETERHLTEAAEALARERAAPLRVGWGRHEITPALGTATWGYGARRGQLTEAVADPLFAHALALTAGDGAPIVFLSADLCAWSAELSGPVATALAPRLSRGRLYFGATHTHNGPGGLGGGPLVQWYMGARDEATFQLVVDGAISAATQALDALAPGAYRELYLDGSEFSVNRTVADDRIDGALTLLEFQRADARFALVVCDAHATSISKEHVVTSGDYPGALIRALRERGFDDALFLAGATGQAGPRVDAALLARRSTEAAEALGRRMAERIAEASRAASAPHRDALVLSALRVPVALPPYRVRALDRALDPGLVGWLLGQAPVSHVHAVRLDDTVFLGHSFEFSAVLDTRLSARAERRGAHLVTTSFNGDHNFYVVPAAYFDIGYESGMTFFGPGLGPYLEWVSERVFDLMLADQP